MSANAIERLLRYVPRQDHWHQCGFFWRSDRCCDCGLEERREDAAAVEALLEAAKDVCQGSLPRLCPTVSVLAAAVRRVETGQ